METKDSGEDTQRIEKEADEYSKGGMYEHRAGYIAGAISQLKELASLREQLKQKEEAIENLNKLLCKHNLKIVTMDSGELDMINLSA